MKPSFTSGGCEAVRGVPAIEYELWFEKALMGELCHAFQGMWFVNKVGELI